MASPLKAELVSRGIAIADDVPNACLPMRAEVSRHGAVVLVSLVEPHGVSVDRAVSNVEIAAIWIESRLHKSVGAPLLLARSPTLSAADPPPVVIGSVVTAGGLGSLGARVALGFSGDASSWRTYSVAGCMAVGRICIGLAADLGEQARVIGPQPDPLLALPQQTTASRLSLDVLATVQRPIELTRIVIVPSVGLGAGWLRTRDASGSCGDPNGCLLPAISYRTVLPRADIALAVWFPITDRIKLDLGMGVRLSPFAHTDPFAHDPTIASCDMFPVPDPATECLTFAGEPLAVWRAGIGLQVSL